MQWDRRDDLRQRFIGAILSPEAELESLRGTPGQPLVKCKRNLSVDHQPDSLNRTAEKRTSSPTPAGQPYMPSDCDHHLAGRDSMGNTGQSHLDKQREHHAPLQESEELPQAVPRALDERHKLHGQDVAVSACVHVMTYCRQFVSRAQVCKRSPARHPHYLENIKEATQSYPEETQLLVKLIVFATRHEAIRSPPLTKHRTSG